MNIIIRNSSGQPIYDQIYEQLRAQIVSGALPEEEMLPSIRGLAKELRISVITTKRAYEELERDGFIYTVAGKGCFVAARNLELVREDHLRKIEEHLSAAVSLARQAGISRGDIDRMLDLLEQEENT
ncbi:MAG: GntR family transcriptional regulator, partial [Butyricicoccus sp.]